MDKKDIKDVLEAANDYLSLLKNLETELNYAERQISDTARASENEINTVFSSLSDILCTTLTDRCKELIKETKKVKEDALLPLQQSQVLISSKIENTIAFIGKAKNLLKKDIPHSEMEDFNQQVSLLGVLPEVPPLKEVPYLSFQHSPDYESNIIDICKGFGSVSSIAPVQISTVLERPGGILIDWNVSENEERFVEKYHLQKALVPVNEIQYYNFNSCYIGAENQYLVKELNLDQSYAFRVCCKFEGDERWSPWSLIQIGKTNIKSVTWETNRDFILNAENKIASPLNLTTVLYSKEIKFNIGYSIELTFLECDNDLSNNFVGLFISNDRKEFAIHEAHICFETNGNIYGYGVKKPMQFSPVIKGTKLSFMCNYKSENKLRIDIDCDNNRVTYDWCVDGKNVFIGVWLCSKKWKIMID